jgi:hypothetical protein
VLFHKESKVAFLLTPRCGSTSLREYLEPLGFSYPLIRCEEEPFFRWHPTYEKCIEVYPNLKNYQMYAVFRDPIEPIPYYGFATRVHEITSGYNAGESRIARYNVTAASKFGPPSEAVREFALKRFSEDYEFGRRIGLLV